MVINKSKIVIIDDEKDLCMMLKGFLEKQNIDADYAHTIEEGLRLVASFQPQLVFLDNNLPDGFGINHVDKIKESVEGVKIVMISAMNPFRDETLSKDIDVFLDKPISLAKFKNIVTEMFHTVP